MWARKALSSVPADLSLRGASLTDKLEREHADVTDVDTSARTRASQRRSGDPKDMVRPGDVHAILTKGCKWWGNC